MTRDCLRFQRFFGSPLLFGLFVGFSTWCISLALQAWIIPYLFSDKGAVDGLVVLDSIGFHRAALEQADLIRKEGWNSWRLVHVGKIDAPIAISSAIYVLFGSSPLNVLALNAILHGLAASVVLLILRKFFEASYAALGALAFAANPTALEWVSQIHRDGIFILGNVLFVLFLLNLVDARLIKTKSLFKTVIPSTIGVLLAGLALTILSRAYWVLILFVIFSVVVLIAIARLIIIDHSNSLFCPLHVRSASILTVAVLLFFLTIIVLKNDSKILAHSVGSQPQVAVQHVKDSSPTFDNPSVQNSASPHAHQKSGWISTAWLPNAIDSIFYNVFVLRRGALLTGGNTLIDKNQPLASVAAQILYLPRAIQLGLLSPFPHLWKGSGSTPAMTLARGASGLITLVSYFFLITAAAGIYQLRRKFGVWILLISCLIGITSFAVTYPNIGALIRFRYTYYMLLVGFGVATCAKLLNSLYRKDKLSD